MIGFPNTKQTIYSTQTAPQMVTMEAIQSAYAKHARAAYLLACLGEANNLSSPLLKLGINHFLRISINADYYPAILMSKAHSGDPDAAYEAFLLHMKGDERWRLPPDPNKGYKYFFCAVHLKHKQALEDLPKMRALPGIELAIKEHGDSHRQLLKISFRDMSIREVSFSNSLKADELRKTVTKNNTNH